MNIEFDITVSATEKDYRIGSSSVRSYGWTHVYRGVKPDDLENVLIDVIDCPFVSSDGKRTVSFDEDRIRGNYEEWCGDDQAFIDVEVVRLKSSAAVANEILAAVKDAKPGWNNSWFMGGEEIDIECIDRSES